ncbi:MAG TPA: CBS domain-containing protein [Nitrosarchaeum sp.]
MMRYVQLKAKDVYKKATTIEPDRSLQDVRKAMLNFNIDRLVVVTKEYKPIGIITEKDIMRLIHIYASSKPIDKIRLGDVMSTNLITVCEESNLSRCVRTMMDESISSLIITDDKYILRGILTKIDVISTYAKYFTGTYLVGDFMTKNVLTVAPDENLHKILLLMINNNVSRVVVTKNHKPVGIITERDIMSLSGLADPYFNRFVKLSHDRFVRYRITKDFTLMQTEMDISGVESILLARDVMKPDPTVVTMDLDLADAVQIMIRNDIHGLPVIDSIASYNLMGIITKTDVNIAMICASS